MKVLIADDDPITLESLEACLLAEGFIPLPAANGEEALELFGSTARDWSASIS